MRHAEGLLSTVVELAQVRRRRGKQARPPAPPQPQGKGAKQPQGLGQGQGQQQQQQQQSPPSTVAAAKLDGIALPQHADVTDLIRKTALRVLAVLGACMCVSVCVRD